MYLHSFQDIDLKLHRYANDSPGQVAETLMILSYPIGVRNNGLITQKNVNSTCIRTVFNTQNWNITGTAATPRETGREEVEDSTVPPTGSGIKAYIVEWYRLPLGTEQVVSSIPGSVGYIPCSLSLRLLGSLRGSLSTYGLTQKLCQKLKLKLIKNKELITQKPKFDVHSHSFQDTELKFHNFITHNFITHSSASAKPRVFISSTYIKIIIIDQYNIICSKSIPRLWLTCDNRIPTSETNAYNYSYVSIHHWKVKYNNYREKN